MIKVICGKKGSGKTKRIVGIANDVAVNGKGSVVYLCDDSRYIRDLHKDIRFINYSDYGAKHSSVLEGIVIGILASNYDVEAIFVDGLLRVVHQSMAELESFFAELEKFTVKSGIVIYFTVSMDENELPEYIKKSII